MTQACATDVLRGALEGYNGCIMCYGQTGAGKTFTMSGGRSSFKQRGIIPRMISHLFAEMRSLSDRQFKVGQIKLRLYERPETDAAYSLQRTACLYSGLGAMTCPATQQQLAHTIRVMEASVYSASVNTYTPQAVCSDKSS